MDLRWVIQMDFPMTCLRSQHLEYHFDLMTAKHMDLMKALYLDL